MSVAAAIAADLVDAELIEHARARRQARRVDSAWWFASGAVVGAVLTAALMLLAARYGVPMVP